MLQIYEILDRVELLYPNNDFYKDLRKTVSSDDKFALFRILQNDNSSALLEGLRKYKDDPFFNVDCFSRGQIKSKQWLLTELEKLNVDLGTIFLCAGWYATLATMLFESECKIDKIRSFDIDKSCVEIAETFNKKWVMDDWKFKAAIENIHSIRYNQHSYTVTRANGTECSLVDKPNTVINTSCEHIDNFSSWYDSLPYGVLLVLQTNNYTEIDDHINCSTSLEEFANNTPMEDVLYEGELDCVVYNRYMRIGYK